MEQKVDVKTRINCETLLLVWERDVNCSHGYWSMKRDFEDKKTQKLRWSSTVLLLIIIVVVVARPTNWIRPAKPSICIRKIFSFVLRQE